MSASSARAIGGVGTSMVAPTRTPASMTDVDAALRKAYVRVTGSTPTPNVLRSLRAQASVETGAGQSMYNFNFGGIKGAGPHGQSAACMTHEVYAGSTVTVRQNFRAYASLDEGAEDYVRLLVGKFPGAMSSASGGDLASFAHALKQAGYYTASESDYAAALGAASGSSSATPAATAPMPSAAGLPSTCDVLRLFDALSTSALRIADPVP